MKTKTEKNKKDYYKYVLMTAAALAVFIMCICIGSVNIPLKDTMRVIYNTVFKLPQDEGIAGSIILKIRIPRVISVALVGAILSLCGAAMQGLLRNPLADGSTIGVSSGASLGAAISIAFGITIPGFQAGGTMFMAMLFAFGSLVLILSLAYRLDFSLSTNTIILLGIIFTMFMNSIISLIVTFAGERIKSIMFWTMGSLASANYMSVWILTAALLIGTVIFRYARELNAFAIGEDNARHIGVNVKKVKLVILITVSVLIGICVSIGGNIGFVGLVIPHMTRMIVGPNHSRLLPSVLFSGAIFLMLADLISRIIFKPLELPLGVVTSLIGSVVFIVIFWRTSRTGRT